MDRIPCPIGQAVPRSRRRRPPFFFRYFTGIRWDVSVQSFPGHVGLSAEGRIPMSQVHTVFGSISDYTKGSVELVSGEARHYVFSNMFEVAAKSEPYERVVVARSIEYVQEV